MKLQTDRGQNHVPLMLDLIFGPNLFASSTLHLSKVLAKVNSFQTDPNFFFKQLFSYPSMQFVKYGFVSLIRTTPNTDSPFQHEDRTKVDEGRSGSLHSVDAAAAAGLHVPGLGANPDIPARD